MDPRISRWAKTLVGYCLEVQPGQIVLINATPAAEPLVAEVYRETLRALTEALGDHRDHSTALGDSRARRCEVTLMCDCGHRVRPAHRQSIREAICTRCNQRDAHHCI